MRFGPSPCNTGVSYSCNTAGLSWQCRTNSAGNGTGRSSLGTSGRPTGRGLRGRMDTNRGPLHPDQSKRGSFVNASVSSCPSVLPSLPDNRRARDSEVLAPLESQVDRHAPDWASCPPLLSGNRHQTSRGMLSVRCSRSRGNMPPSWQAQCLELLFAAFSEVVLTGWHWLEAANVAKRLPNAPAHSGNWPRRHCSRGVSHSRPWER